MRCSITPASRNSAWGSCLYVLRLELYSIPAPTLFRKGGGKPPHSEVGWPCFDKGGSAIDRIGGEIQLQEQNNQAKAPPFAESAKDGPP
jgi:hypothetical protein